MFPYLIALFAISMAISGCTPFNMPSQLSVPPPQMANVTCNELSLYLDPALGNDYECKNVPESSSSDIPMDIFVYPPHTELAIRDYPLTHTQFPPMIYVYPVDRFSKLLPEVLPRRVFDLSSLTSGGTLNSRVLPFLPPVPLTQAFFSHETVISFNAGQGIRFITQYNEFDNPISNTTMFYTFQGLTDDGTHWVAVTLPISNPILPANDYTPLPPEGYSLETWLQDYDSFISQVKDALEAQAPGSFSPTINTLDGLISSIHVRP